MPQARAATLVGTPGAVSGIIGLAVDRVSYDVTFMFGSYEEVYVAPGTTPTFLDNQPNAELAANLIIELFNAEEVPSTVDTDADIVTGEVSHFFIPYHTFSSSISVVAATNTAPAGTAAAWNMDRSVADTTTNTMFAVFTPTAVPVPTALPLFASGLGVIGLLGWRRKRKKAAA